VIKTIEIQNFKSIDNLKISLGRINVFVGENGAGKSNILEGIALAGAASARKLDSEFLISRGIRVTQPQLMRPRFPGFSESEIISIDVTPEDKAPVSFLMKNDNKPYSNWEHTASVKDGSEGALSQKFQDFLESKTTSKNEMLEVIKNLSKALDESKKSQPKRRGKKALPITVPISASTSFFNFITSYQEELVAPYKELSDFIIYSPENTALRLFDKEGQIEPLGINGEGLIKLLNVLSESDNKDPINSINGSLRLLDWFDGLTIKAEQGSMPASLEIQDRFLDADHASFDQRSANEGFLFLAFYFALFSTELTPSFFAIDNIDASLNPKLCRKLIQIIVNLSKKNNKQAILTTHNPAILDGLNLSDDDQRLFVVSRDIDGFSNVRRITKDKDDKIPLSEMFMSGLIGGLPNGF